METPNEAVDPCQAEKTAHDEAMQEWLRLQGRASAYVSTKARGFGEDAQPVPSMAAEYDAADAAKRVYEERLRAYRACVLAHSAGGSPGWQAGTGS